jgi:hypothetical protein
MNVKRCSIDEGGDIKMLVGRGSIFGAIFFLPMCIVCDRWKGYSIDEGGDVQVVIEKASLFTYLLLVTLPIRVSKK